MIEGELKERIRKLKDVLCVHLETEVCNCYIEENVYAILDKAAREFPTYSIAKKKRDEEHNPHFRYRANIRTVQVRLIEDWFKKWFGELK